MSVDTLFEPLETPKITLKNRVAMAPMARNYAPNFIPDEKIAAYYARRAHHGVGLIITEASFIDHPVSNGHKGTPAIFGEAALAGYRRVVERVHEEGGQIFCQIWHMGGERPEGGIPNPELPSLSPSGILKPGVRQGRAITLAEIKEVQASYARAAADAKRIGFDGVEIHGAHGYLIDSFMWEAVNLRDDAYGGSFERRLTFAREVIEQVRAAVGPDFPVSFRTSQWKSQDYNAKIYATPDQLGLALATFVDAGVDFFHCSTRRFWEPEFAGSELSFPAWVRKLSGKPTITAGSVTLDSAFTMVDDPTSGRRAVASARPTADIDTVVKAIERGDFDIIAVGRALLANPDWVDKVKAGQLDRIEMFTKEHVKILY